MMNKKTIKFILIYLLILIFTNNYSVAANENIFNNKDLKYYLGLEKNQENDIEDQENYTEDYKKYLKLSDEEKAKVGVIPRKYNVPLDMIYEDTKEVKESANLSNLFGLFAKSTLQSTYADELPAKFDLRDKINIRVENQGSVGLCWAFASIKSMETNLLLKTGYDENLSEMHVAYITAMYNGFSSGVLNGNWEYFQTYLLNNKGPVREETVPFERIKSENQYEYFDNLEPMAFANEVVNFPSISKKYEEYTDEELRLFREKVKEHIIKNGSIYCEIYSPTVDEKYWSDENFASYYNGGSRTDYYANTVSIIGWDDNYSRNNFNENCRPEHDGAYIALNSYGEDWGDNGVFYISYDDVEVEADMNGIISSDIKPDTQEIVFNDYNLYKKLKNELGKKIIEYNDQEHSMIVNKSVLSTLKYIYIQQKEDIHDLSGLENFVNIDSLYIQNIENLDCNFIRNFKNLKTLTLTNCNIVDIDFLRECTSIEFLDLSNNEIKNISVLSNLDKLAMLYLSNNQIENIEALSNLTNLMELNLSKNNISSISALSNLKKIYILGIGSNEIEDISILSQLEDINMLDISNNVNLNNLDVLVSLENLYDLDISKINNIHNLDKLNIFKLTMNDIEFTEDIERQILELSDNLEYLSLQNCNIIDASFLENFILYHLDLSKNKNIKLETIPKFFSYSFGRSHLSLSECELENLDGLNGSMIGDLDVSNNNIKNIDAIEDMSMLMSIVLDNNGITDEIYNNMVEKLNKIAYVSLKGNNISQEIEYGVSITNVNVGNIQIDTKNYFSFDRLLKEEIDEEDEDDLIWSSQETELEYYLNQLNRGKYMYNYNQYPFSDIVIENGDIDYNLKCFVIEPNKLGEGKTTIKLSGDCILILNYNVVNESIIDKIIPIDVGKTTYIEGENFDLLGVEDNVIDIITGRYPYKINKSRKMRIKYKSGYYYETTDFSVINGESLKSNQKSVTVKINHLNLTTEIPITVYNEYNGIKCIDIDLQTNIQQIREQISNILKIEDKDGNELQDDNFIITTGTKITRTDGTEYVILIKGDTNGDGQADIIDMRMINNYRLYNTTTNFDEIYRLAGDVNKDNKLDIKDIRIINNYRLYGTKF